MNYKLTIEYDGSRYEGWQRQKTTGQTIQGKIERILSRMTGEEIQIDGAGRTDGGVHAKGQTASVRLDGTWSKEEILDYLNQYLPEDIGITRVDRVPERFHARLWATGKCYSYRIGTDSRKAVFDRKYRYHLGEALDVEAMRRAAEDLIGTHDFRSFCGNPRMKKSTIRTITEIRIEELPHEVRLVYTGNGFLQYMVRILTGTLIEIGLHQRPADSIPELLERKERKYAGATAPAQGLCLEQVFY
ncbi:MAG: tRNA pseudouridine(38-40) synthase TruA [Clostridiales bacterium]|nr:tRNA pseudouridine(38-40) synthase TruA [Clostridiales bacterium]